MTVGSASVRELLAQATTRLVDAGVESARHDAEALLAHVLGVPRLHVAWVEGLTATDLDRFERLLDRRVDREPLQHLLGVAAFRHLELAVGPGVFVPRPETEVLAEWAVGAARERVRTGDEPPVVVDLCTGSGVLALALATEVPQARVYAVELDAGAYAWAARNLAACPGAHVTLALGDAAEAFPALDGGVDVVTANPPYIPLEAWESVAVEVRDHDPPLALWSGADGLDGVRMVERTAARLLRSGGAVACEHADAHGDSAPEVFAGTRRWREVRDHPDLAGRPRFVTARRA